MTISITLRRLLPWALGCLVAGSLAAQTPSETGEGNEQAPASRPTTAATPEVPAPGVRVYIDPETGELTSEPTGDQMQRLLELGRALVREREQLDAGTGVLEAREPVRIFPTPAGLGAVVPDRFMHGLRAIILPNGQLGFLCSQAGDPTHTHADAAPER